VQALLSRAAGPTTSEPGLSLARLAAEPWDRVRIVEGALGTWSGSVIAAAPEGAHSVPLDKALRRVSTSSGELRAPIVLSRPASQTGQLRQARRGRDVQGNWDLSTGAGAHRYAAGRDCAGRRDRIALAGRRLGLAGRRDRPRWPPWSMAFNPRRITLPVATGGVRAGKGAMRGA